MQGSSPISILTRIRPRWSLIGSSVMCLAVVMVRWERTWVCGGTFILIWGMAITDFSSTFWSAGSNSWGKVAVSRIQHVLLIRLKMKQLWRRRCAGTWNRLRLSTSAKKSPHIWSTGPDLRDGKCIIKGKGRGRRRCGTKATKMCQSLEEKSWGRRCLRMFIRRWIMSQRGSMIPSSRLIRLGWGIVWGFTLMMIIRVASLWP